MKGLKKQIVIPSSIKTTGLSYCLWSNFLLLGKKKLNIPYFSNYKTHLPPKKNWEENGGASYSINVAYLGHWGEGSGVVWFFYYYYYFPPLKPRCVLRSSVSYGLKNTIHLTGRINTETWYLFLLWRAIRRVNGASVSMIMLGIDFLNLGSINILDWIILCWGEEEASRRGLSCAL